MTDTVTPTQADLIERLECFDWGCSNAERIAKEAANTIATQAAEIARLRELVASAYAEGWGDAVLGIVSEGPDAWNGSNARATLSAQTSEQEGGE
jgi:hypothetical protein